LKQNASEVARQAAAGDVIAITDRGKPVARIVPLRPLRASRLTEMRNDERFSLVAWYRPPQQWSS
jgi:prevent-host-death family protein